ncbi:DJ-1/PfpI family protein [Leptospira montravelensis]|uniref:DJ-1/PfpI family protein n=1 Tax=Leptospira montravelensis TaxID=2484961 RepID=A0ABY2LM90_9LEPT|nr:DJ-1 family glyoxalase III [Leptospira montravelensis]TGK80095.1 DJ-1/PfpI family protein [Leptospira montravelensis]TGL00265.1 DJ-1/PfpI family protein [Leptospira montravelensis]
MAKRVFIPLCPGFEEMEAIILIDVLRRGNVEVVSGGKSKDPILAARKTLHLADKTFSEIIPSEFDAILLPGGLEGTKQLMKDPEISSILKSFHQQSKMIGAICAAPSVLRYLDIISGDDPYTAFPSADDLAKGKGGMYTGKRIESHNHIHTSIGPGSAFEFALYILESLEGKEVMEKVKLGLHLP